MEKKLSKESIQILSLMLILVVPFFSNSTIVVTLGIILATGCSWYFGTKERLASRKVRKYYHDLLFVSLLAGGIAAMVFISQFILYHLNFHDALIQIKTIVQIYAGIVVVMFFFYGCIRLDVYIKALTVYIIFFSAYYVCYVLIHGLPNERSSIFGSFSSNYVAASLYLCYPLLLFYLFECAKTKKERYWIIAALVLSIIVILSTGSRTSLGIVGAVAIIQYFIMSKKRKYSILCNFLVVLCVLVLVGGYFGIPSFRILFTRALEALGGTKTVNNDIRIVIWESFRKEIANHNRLIGAATNMVDTFGWSQPAHNFAYEILLDMGLIGAIAYIVHTVIVLFYAFVVARGVKKMYLLQSVVSFLITAYVQPFFSTSFNCGFLFWISICFIAFSQNKMTNSGSWEKHCE